MDAVGNVLPQVIKDGASEEKGEVARLVTIFLCSLPSSVRLQWPILLKQHWVLEGWIRY